VESDVDDMMFSASTILSHWIYRHHGVNVTMPSYEWCYDAATGVTTETAAASLKAIHGWDIRDRLSELQMPVLVVSGDRDRSVPLETPVFQKQTIRNSQLCIIPGCAHIPHLENPDMFNMALKEFLTTPFPTANP
jgi:2-hydroxy-6-oxonona-2,4-dienedioate hydrolase